MRQMYRVSFFKKLTDSTGHPVDEARGPKFVLPAGMAQLSLPGPGSPKIKDVGTWTLRADYETVELLASRKRVSMRPWRNSHEELLLAR